MSGYDDLKGYWRIKTGQVDREGMRDLTAMNQSTMVSDGTRLLSELQAMVKRGEIAQAQALLIERLKDQPSAESEDVVQVFYEDLADLSDAALAQSGVTRAQIEQSHARARELCGGMFPFSF